MLFAFSCVGALPPGVVGKKIPDYGNLPVPPTTYMFLISDPSGNYFNLTLGQLQAMGTNSGTLIITNLSVQYVTNLFAYLTNIYSTNLNVTWITNVTLINSNIYSTNITAITLNATTNILNYITNITLVTTNVTIQAPGGFTNENLTPYTFMFADKNDAESSFPNGTGVLTNGGAGSGDIAWTMTLKLTEVDVSNFYPTNLFTGLTNVAELGTDANGLLVVGSSTITNITITNLYAQIITNVTFVNTNTFISTSNAFLNNTYITNLYGDIITNNTFVNTNTVIISGKASVNTLIVTNVSVYGNLTNQNATASTIAAYDANKVLGSLANAYGVLTNSGSAAGYNSVYPQGNGAALTNLTYQYNTNAITTGVLTFGQAYRTNIAADITINSLVLGSTVSYESMVLLVTNSDTAAHKITWPSGVFSGGVAAVSWITNGYWSEVLVDHFATLYTNAVTKN